MDISIVAATFDYIFQCGAVVRMKLMGACYFPFGGNHQVEVTSHMARMALTYSLRLFGDNSHFPNISWYELRI